MDREISYMTALAIALVGTGAIISLIWVTLFIGKDMQSSSTEGIVNVSNDMSINYIRSLSSGETDNEMPTATAYNIMRTYGDIITEAACGSNGGVTNLMAEAPCLESELKGRTSLQLMELPTGEFVALAHVVDYPDPSSPTGYTSCNWFDKSPVTGLGQCTCPENHSGFAQLKVQKELTDQDLGWYPM